MIKLIHRILQHNNYVCYLEVNKGLSGSRYYGKFLALGITARAKESKFYYSSSDDVFRLDTRNVHLYPKSPLMHCYQCNKLHIKLSNCQEKSKTVYKHFYLGGFINEMPGP